MRKAVGIAIAIWLSQPAQAESPAYEFIDVGSAPGGAAQIYSAFLLVSRKQVLRMLRFLQKRPAAHCSLPRRYRLLPAKRDCKRIECTKRGPHR